MSRWLRLPIGVASVLLFVAHFSGLALAAEVTVFASTAIAEVMTELAPEFERATGQQVIVLYEPTNAIMARVKNGEMSDAVILIKQSIDDLKSAGNVEPNSGTDLAKTRIGLAVRSGSPWPDISTPEAFKRAMLDAGSVACSEVGASGIHFRRVLDRLGISDAMKPKLKVVKGATRTASLVAKGEAEIAVQMISELKPISGVDVVGPLPGELHFEIVLTAGLSQNAKNPEGARRLIEFLERPSTAPVYAKAGMERI